VSFRKARRVIDMAFAEATAELEKEVAELAGIREQARIRSEFYALSAQATAPEPADVWDGCGPQTIAAMRRADQYRNQAAEDAAFWAQLDQLTRAAQKEVARRKKAGKK